ncbi:DUF3854 domain-containing protein [Anaerobacillus sp. 1_MG-2023]|uniref:DUF3854 domain-containing protein n=1 Tax=Anaerobacillus sp. 1_MG-2023 TaxID=3062655 RepID=UPI0026E18B88|nr:DUF3854 domain-containing protein [Anaerobacillus sp. 1_MG-2023]MDO6657386.1 DUF3854 domain-containing protein [Anaerobacillus sp. 1_MG-2023]
MLQDMRRTRINGWFEYYRIACPICGHTGGCMQHKDGKAIACIRVQSDRYFSKNSSLPSYLHILDSEQQRNRIKDSQVAPQGLQKKEDAILQTVYSTMLECLELTDGHYIHLTSKDRQLNDEQIRIRDYRSFPEQPWNTVKEMQELLGVQGFEGVPGFYLAKGKFGQYWSISGVDGILIPYRNVRNEIVGFQYRLDTPPNDMKVTQIRDGLSARVIKQPNLVQVTYKGEIVLEKELTMKETEKVKFGDDVLGWVTLKKGNRYYWLSSANKPQGTGSGNPAPVHISVPTKKLSSWESGKTLKAKTVWLSEGPLKTDIAADCIEKLFDPEEIDVVGDTFIALPGVNSWRVCLPVLEEMEVEEINLCFDSDVVSNPFVRKQLMEAAKELHSRGYRMNMVIWNAKDGSGIDDLLINSKLPQIKKLM